MNPFLVAFLVLGFLGLVVAGIVAARRERREHRRILDRLGFRPCPDEADRIRAAVSAIENNKRCLVEVRDPRKLDDRKPVFHYTKVQKYGPHDDEPVVEEEVLFPLERRSRDGLVLVIKPSAVASGLATRLMRAVAAIPTDRKPEDLERIDVQPDPSHENLVAALGPRGARLLDLVDSGTLAVVLGLGDSGVLQVRFRGGWCSLASIGRALPFRVGQLLSRIRPLLR